MTPEGGKEPELRKFGETTGTFADIDVTSTTTLRTGTVIVWDRIDTTLTYNAPPVRPEPEVTPLCISGKCKFCGKFQNGLVYHENNVCNKRFRRR